MSIQNSMKIVTTCTRDCPSTCGQIAHVTDGRVTALSGNREHPVTKGHICGKLRHYLTRVYSPDRVLHPMRRSSRSGPWKPCTWDDALDEVAEHMVRLKDHPGPESILYYQGFGTRTALELLNARFFNAFGGVSTLCGTLCGGTGEAAQNLDFGKRISHDPLDHINAKTLVLWGRNPVATQRPLVPIITEMQRLGGQVIVVDPIYSKTAKIADRHIHPAPGKDMWLALAVAAYIFEKGWQNNAFLDNHTENLMAYRELVSRWTLSELIAGADVPKADVAYLAEGIAKHRPAAILLGWGLHRWKQAHLTIRTIDALSAVSGNVGISGGGVSQGFDEYGPYDLGAKGEDLCPPRRKLLMPRIGEEILEATAPSIEMIFVTGGNPVNMAPDSHVVSAAFDKTPFVVYCGHFMDDTADASDLFLPGTTYLEEQSVVAGYGHDAVGPVNRAIEPLGESRTHFQIFAALAERLGIDEFRCGETVWLNRLLSPLQEKGIDLDMINRGPVRMGLPPVPYLNKRFSTPSGKMRLLDRIDDALSPLQLPTSQWPYALLSTSPKKRLCSEWLPDDHQSLPVVTLSANEACRKGLSDGDKVEVRSDSGTLEAILKTDSRQRDDVAILPRGGWRSRGHGVNLLTKSEVSAVGNGAAYYETRVDVSAVSSELLSTIVTK